MNVADLEAELVFEAEEQRLEVGELLARVLFLYLLLVRSLSFLLKELGQVPNLSLEESCLVSGVAVKAHRGVGHLSREMLLLLWRYKLNRLLLKEGSSGD